MLCIIDMCPKDIPIISLTHYSCRAVIYAQPITRSEIITDNESKCVQYTTPRLSLIVPVNTLLTYLLLPETS